MKFIVTHGSFKTPDGVKTVGMPIELDEAEAKKMDPKGECLKPAELAAKEAKAEAAKMAVMRDGKAEEPKAGGK